MPRSRAGAGETAFERAVARLSRRDWSEAELSKALSRDGFSKPEIDSALELLRAKRFLDDRRYAQRRARRGLQDRAMGRFRVRAELRARGIAPRIAEEALSEALAEVPEKERIDALARAWWKLHVRGDEVSRVSRLGGFLARRGFPSSVVAERLRMLFPRQAARFFDVSDEPADD